MEQGKNRARLVADVDHELVGGEVRVDLVSAAGAADYLAFEVERERAFVGGLVLDLGELVSGLEAGEDVVAHERVLGDLLFDGRGEALLKPDEVEYVADVHEGEGLVLGHDFAVLAVALRFGLEVLVPGLLALLEVFYLHSADVGEVRGVARGFVVVLFKLGEFFEEFRIGVRLSLHERSVAVPECELRRVVE